MSKMKASVFEGGADTKAALTVLGATPKKKRKPSTHYVLVRWDDDDAGLLTIETKKHLREFYYNYHNVTVMCDDQPYAVLVKMYELAQENK